MREFFDFPILPVFLQFWAENELTEAREVFKKLLGGRTLLCDTLWSQTEPRGPDSWPKLWFQDT